MAFVKGAPSFTRTAGSATSRPSSRQAYLVVGGLVAVAAGLLLLGRTQAGSALEAVNLPTIS